VSLERSFGRRSSIGWCTTRIGWSSRAGNRCARPGRWAPAPRASHDLGRHAAAAPRPGARFSRFLGVLQVGVGARSWLVGHPGAKSFAPSRSRAIHPGPGRRADPPPRRGALRAWAPSPPPPPTQRKHGLWKVPRLMETADPTGPARVAALRCPRPPRPPVRRFHSRLQTGSRPPAAPALHHPPSPVRTPPTAPATTSPIHFLGRNERSPRRRFAPTGGRLRRNRWSPSPESASPRRLGLRPSLPPTTMHRCNCRRCTSVVDAGQSRHGSGRR
jgi:hypothetical protein